MYWEITCHNGTVWTASGKMPLVKALLNFERATGLHEMDIKSIKDLS